MTSATKNAARERAAWALAALVFATALVGTWQFYRSGAFSEAWLRWSLGLYAAAAAGALLLAITARAKAETPAAKPSAPELVYETKTGKLEKHASADGPRYVALFADGRDGLADVERRLDALPVAPIDASAEAAADAAVARRAVAPQTTPASAKPKQGGIAQ